MFRMPTLRLGRILGIPVELNASWFLVFAIVGWTWSADIYPSLFPGRPWWIDAGSGLATTLLFFASIVAHELSHSFVADRAGIPVLRVTLFMFGGVAQLSEEPRTPGVEAVMSVAGPAMSLALAVVSFGLYSAVRGAGGSESGFSPLLMLSGVNLSIAVFNLAPGYPMDGGRVVHSLLWWATGDRRLSTRLASLAGQAMGLALAVAGVSVLVSGSLEGAWFVLLGLFLRSLASAAYRDQMARLDFAATPVSDVMDAPVPVVSGSASLRETLRDLAGAAPGMQAAVAGGDGVLAGTVSFRHALEVMALGTGGETISDAVESPDPSRFIDARESLVIAARRFEAGGGDGFLVVSDGRVVGQLSRSAVGEGLVSLASAQRPAGPLRWLTPRA